MASLGHFISKFDGKALPFFKWTPKANVAFEGLRKYLTSPPIKVALCPREPLLLYLAATPKTVSATLVTEQKEQTHINPHPDPSRGAVPQTAAPRPSHLTRRQDAVSPPRLAAANLDALLSYLTCRRRPHSPSRQAAVSPPHLAAANLDALLSYLTCRRRPHSPSRQAAVSPPSSRTRCCRNRPISLCAVVAKQASRCLTSTLVSIAGGPTPVQEQRKQACRQELEAARLCLPAGCTGGGWPWRTATLFKRRTLLSTSSSSGPSHFPLPTASSPHLLRNVLLHALAAKSPSDGFEHRQPCERPWLWTWMLATRDAEKEHTACPLLS
ncbi:uncharacterized protein LOC119357900 [Triticum dicoccoides]|uniref:uncharacterized protein LOC119357900 n=1 Tax=Triticum dicoccoides TaxID=85692 RepID=UPI00188F9AB7|nr:uncharacterized protein LOC119357900 [Triticum dicoccoides]